MAVAVESTTGSGGATAIASFTFSHTVTAANMLIVSVGWGDSSLGISSVTYNAVAMTLVDSHDDGVFERVAIYQLASPATGVHNVVVTFGATINGGASGATGFTGASATLGTASKTTASTANPSLTVVDSASGDIVIAIVADDNSTPTTVPAGTQEWTAEDVASDSDFNCQTVSASGANTVCSWTNSETGSGAWAAVGVAIKASAGADTLMAQAVM